MNCCPLQSDADGFIEDFFSKQRTARKDHACTECFETIPKGTKYENASGFWEGRPVDFKTCASCVEIRDHFACDGGYIFGQLWEDLEQNFFPDMKAGGPCLEGLSPQAKNRLFEKRTEWLLRE